MGSGTGIRTVQVCDDDAGVRGILVRLLSPYFTVVEAGTGQEALRLIEERSPDLVVLDMVMPGLGGLETLEAYRKTHPHLPTLVLTGDMRPESACRALELGAHAYITKPFDMSELLDEVRGLLGADDPERPPWRLK